MSSNAQVTPKVLPEIPVAGQKYILVNKAQTATQYMSRTSWDGSLYFLGEKDSNYADNALTAVDNNDGTWSFVRVVKEERETGEVDGDGNAVKELVDVTYYMGIPDGTANVKSNLTTPAYWKLWDMKNGFYNLIMGGATMPQHWRWQRTLRQKTCVCISIMVASILWQHTIQALGIQTVRAA